MEDGPDTEEEIVRANAAGAGAAKRRGKAGVGKRKSKVGKERAQGAALNNRQQQIKQYSSIYGSISDYH